MTEHPSIVSCCYRETEELNARALLVMAKRECPSCAMEVDNKNRSCPICGYEFPDYSKGFKLLAILLILLFILFFIL